MSLTIQSFARLAACWLLAMSLLSPAASAVHPKRGWAGAEQAKVQGTNSSWFYDWSDINDEPLNGTGEFVPMFYSAADVTPERVAEVLVNYPDATHILGMNEPDQPSQGVSTVAEALAAWPLIESTGLRTVSPANLSDSGGRAWSREFLNEAESRGYRVDVVGVHWYGNFFSVDYNNPEETAARFLSDIESWYTEYQKPLWITEFGVRDTSDQIDPALIGGHNERFLEIVLPELDNRDYVERYAWFNWEEDLRLISGNPLTPTPLGQVYAGAARPGVTIDFRGQNRGEELLYLRGGTITNTTRPGDAGGRYLQVLASVEGEVGVLGGISEWTIADGYFWSRPDSAVRKEGIGEVVVHNSDFPQSGVIEVAEGAFRLSGTTTLRGAGRFAILEGGALWLGGANDTRPITVRKSLEFHGGTFGAGGGATGAHVLEGDQTLVATSRFEVENALDLHGSVTGTGEAGLIKSGPGRLRLFAEATFSGDTVVEEGVLEIGVNNSLDGSPRIELGAGGEIDASVRRLGVRIGAGRELVAAPGATIRGLVTIDPDATLRLSLGDASDHEPFRAPTAFATSGDLVVALAEGVAAPGAGDVFTLIETPSLGGEFVSIALPQLPAGLVWNDDALHSSGVIEVGLIGDYNADGQVDAADFTVWRDNVGAAEITNRDPAITGAIGANDYAAWEANFGRAASAAEAVPEPQTLCLWLLASGRFCLPHRRR